MVQEVGKYFESEWKANKEEQLRANSPTPLTFGGRKQLHLVYIK